MSFNKKIYTVDDFSWYYKKLKSDFYFNKLSESEKKDIIHYSMESAKVQFENITASNQKMSAEYYIEKQEISIVYEKDDLINDYIYFALYKPYEKRIVIQTKAVSMLLKNIETYELSELIKREQVIQTILFHELFHHLEEIVPFIYTRSKMLKRKFLFFKYNRGLAISSEIGAIHFSKLMTGLNYSPCLYEEILLGIFN